MNKQLLRLERRRRRKKGDTAKLAAQLAPLEEQDKRVAKDESEFGGALRHTIAHHEPGAIVVERDNAGASEGLGRNKKGVDVLEPVVIVILCLVLAWIVFITWQISLMPN